MKDHEIEALEEVFGVTDITDPHERRAEVERRFNALNKLERAAILMKVGARASELEARTPGARYSPPTWTLAVTSGLFLVLAALVAYAVAGTSWPLAIKVPLGFLGLIWFLMAWRASARVIFRLANGRDC